MDLEARSAAAMLTALPCRAVTFAGVAFDFASPPLAPPPPPLLPLPGAVAPPRAGVFSTLAAGYAEPFVATAGDDATPTRGLQDGAARGSVLVGADPFDSPAPSLAALGRGARVAAQLSAMDEIWETALMQHEGASAAYKKAVGVLEAVLASSQELTGELVTVLLGRCAALRNMSDHVSAVALDSVRLLGATETKLIDVMQVVLAAARNDARTPAAAVAAASGEPTGAAPDAAGGSSDGAASSRGGGEATGEEKDRLAKKARLDANGSR